MSNSIIFIYMFCGGLILGLLISIVFFYIFFRIKRLEDAVYTFPSIEEIAKEVLNSKLSPEDLSPELQIAYNNFVQQKGNNKNPLSESKNRNSYIG